MSVLSPRASFTDAKQAVLSNSPWYVRNYPVQSELILGLGWTWVQSQPITSFKKKRKRDKQARLDCKEYIKNNYKENAKSSVIGGIILSFVLNMIMNWIINKLLNSLFNNE